MYYEIPNQKLVQIVESSIDTNIKDSDASYYITPINDKEFSSIEFTFNFKTGGVQESIKFILDVAFPSREQQTSIIHFLSQKISGLEEQIKKMDDDLTHVGK